MAQGILPSAAATPSSVEIHSCEKRCMQDFISRQNIERFRKLLNKACDEEERRILCQLLEAEEKKLADSQAAATGKEPGDQT
ncbi:hypothetical protein [Rhizobium mayense]|uniref:Uncharacterized protein n=1 Tax=Rhizobium mayense TaxID=1312184 RepID=A0ABT7JPM7_9HYPH|nr:hypothetical protein [Rhizobium mayense]MDL2398309.1 hypothetical protein [Rhizobium mayense]